MKLEPVYLLAPEPDRRVKLSRRALLGYLVGAFAAGAVGAHSVSVWRRTRMEQSRVPEHGSKPPVEVDMLTWARTVAAGPTEVLLDSTAAFVAAVHRYPTDEVLWGGVERLARHLMQFPSRDRFREATSVGNVLLRSPIAGHQELRAELMRRLEDSK